MQVIDHHFAHGPVSLEGASGPITLTPGPLQDLRVFAVTYAPGEKWNEAVGEQAFAAGVSEINTIMAGHNTIVGHALTVIQNLGIKTTPEQSSAIAAAAAGADKLIGTKVTVESALGVVASVLGSVGVIPSGIAGLLPTIENAVEALLKKI